MQMQTQVANLVKNIFAEKENQGGIKNVVWIGAGGSYAGFYPAQYFMEHESTKIKSYSYTSNEFRLATPKFVNANTLAIVCSMRGTPETIAAAQAAKDRGAATIGLYVENSDMTKVCEHLIKYESIALDESSQEKTNSSIGLCIAINLVNEAEGYSHYQEAMDAFNLIDPLYRKAVAYCKPLAKEWAAKNKNEQTIYILGSGPAWGSAYIFSICNIEEMLQINGPAVNSCEYFHGPFEVTDKNKSFFVLISDGRTRAADLRAVRFLKKYGGDKVYLLDAKELGLDNIKDSVSEYFNHCLFSPILNNVYTRALSAVTKVDYLTRRYMWKVKY